MTHAELRSLAFAVLAVFLAILLSACETAAPHLITRNLPAYEARMPKSDVQHVHTTAYTHTESDHAIYSNHNALGGMLQPASAPARRAESNDSLPVLTVTVVRHLRPQIFSTESASASLATLSKTKTTTKSTAKDKKAGKTAKKGKPEVRKATKAVIGSAAADWARWPAGTTFRLVSTGQTYRIDDYGWALSGRNTIDLYMASPKEMNSWGAREEPIQILHWGDPQESLRLLQPHQSAKHIQRMILELQGREEEAAALR